MRSEILSQWNIPSSYEVGIVKFIGIKESKHFFIRNFYFRIHNNERPYQCAICGKSFVQVSTHKAHMLTHSNEYNYPCSECDKKFKQATNLKLHMRVHTKETPYTW